MKWMHRWWLMPVLVWMLVQCKGSSSALDAATPYDAVAVDLTDDGGDPGVLVLAATQVSDPTTIVVDTTSVYWTSPTAVMKLGKNGGQPVVLASAAPPALAVDRTSVYYVWSYNITRMPLDGGLAVPLASVGLTEAIALGATGVYWADNRGPIMGVPYAGGAATRLSFGNCYPARLAIDATFAYWIDCGVSRVPLEGGQTAVLSATPLASVGVRVAVDSSGIYFTLPGSSGGVFAMALDGGSPRMLAEGQQVSGLALDDVNVYWTDTGMGTVAYVPKSGGPSVVLAAAQNGPRAIALDAPYVFIATADAILRIRTP